MSLVMDPLPPFFNSPSLPSAHLLSLQRSLPPTTSAPAAGHLAAGNNLQQSVFSAQNRGVSKTGLAHTRPVSNLPASTRLESILPDQIREQLPASPGRSQSSSWSSPRQAPRPHVFFDSKQASNPVNPNWVVPTPPHSDSGISGITADTQSFSSASPQPTSSFGSGTSGVMSVNYGIPSQYGSMGIEDPNMHSQNYSFDQGYRHAVPQQPTSQPYDYSQGSSLSNVLSSSNARTSSPVSLPHQHYNDDYRLSSAYDGGRTHTSGVMPRPLPSTSLGPTSAGYPSAGYGATGSPRVLPSEGSATRSPSMYEPGMYGQQQLQMPPGMAYNQQLYGSPSVQSLPRSMSSSTSTPSADRVSTQKPKPQCWEHGCNGRKFSTFSNLLRHQREKSGTATKSYCPKCGAEFTRTTARNGHLAHEKCSKPRKSSPESN